MSNIRLDPPNSYGKWSKLGWQAFCDGKTPAANPNPSAAIGLAWEAGFNEARKAMKNYHSMLDAQGMEAKKFDAEQEALDCLARELEL